jgi:quercetin dioxygenase-like cupin family protein
MNQAEFESRLRREGYEAVTREMTAGTVNAEHAHEFDAHVLILEGEMTLTCEGETKVCRAGDSFALPAGRRHAEQCGPVGVRYLAGRRHAVAPSAP